jgi:hypothetical protein
LNFRALEEKNVFSPHIIGLSDLLQTCTEGYLKRYDGTVESSLKERHPLLVLE